MRKLIRLILASVLAFLAIPTISVFAFDAWLLARSDGAAGLKVARTILVQDILRSQLRIWQSKDAYPREPISSRKTVVPVISIAPPTPDLRFDIPDCTELPKEQLDFDPAIHNSADQQAWFYANERDLALENSKIEMILSRSTDLRLAFIDSCMKTSIFADQCAQSFKENENRYDYGLQLEMMAKIGAFGYTKGKPCWRYPKTGIRYRDRFKN